MTASPLVSVVMPSYNHELFIATAIQSILNQTYDNFEVIVVDDGSTDQSNSIIRSFDDRRIKHIPLRLNIGACAAMNLAVQRAKGEFIAVCNSDDIWLPDKLQLQIEVMRNMPQVGVIFSNVEWIDDRGLILKMHAKPVFADVFNQPNRSRFGWLRHLIENGNCLCHPSALIRRKVFNKVGLYNNLLRQLPDLDMWIRIVQHFEIGVMSNKLLHFRIHDNNTSQVNDVTKRRTWREHSLILETFFSCVEHQNFVRSFGGTTLTSLSSNSSDEFELEKYYYLTAYNGPFRSLFKEIASRSAFALALRGQFELNALRFHDLSASIPLPESEESDRLEDEIARLQAELEALRRSSSWRATQLLRDSADFLKTLLRNNK